MDSADLIALISRLENSIISLARVVAPRYSDIDDFAQIGRIAVFELSHDTSVPHPDVYYIDAARYAMKIFSSTSNAKIPNGFSSLDAVFSGTDNFSLYDVISDNSVPDALTQTILNEDNSLKKSFSKNEVYNLLVQKRGKQYVKSLLKEPHPRLVVRDIFRSAIEDVAEFSRADVIKNVDYQFFLNRNLGWMLWVFYENSPFAAILDIYGTEIQPWEMKHAPKNYWTGKRGYTRALQALDWFCEKNNIHSVADCSPVTAHDFFDAGLRGMLQVVFHSSSYLALKAQFPALTLQQRRYAKNKYPNRESIHERLLEFLMDNGVHNFDSLTLPEVFDSRIRNVSITNLRTIFSGVIARDPCYKGSAYKLLEDYFPNQIRPWMISGPHSGWDENRTEKSVQAFRWLIEEYIPLEVIQIPQYITDKKLRQYGFGGIISKSPFNNSVYSLINHAYPGVFTPRSFFSHRKIEQLLPKS